MREMDELMPLRWLLFFIFCQQFTGAPAISSLRFVHVLWRHGDRNPWTTFPTDPKNPKSRRHLVRRMGRTHPGTHSIAETHQIFVTKAKSANSIVHVQCMDGLDDSSDFDAVLQRGANQHFQLGRWLRQEYNGFINSTYNTKEVYVRSTSYNRTIMSAMANMAGLFPPTGIQQWNQNINWQPIPIHSRPKYTDPMLYMHTPCKIINGLYENILARSDKIKQIDAEYKQLYAFLSEKSGFTIKTLSDIDAIQDILLIESTFRPQRLAPWVNATIVETLNHLYNLETIYWCYNNPTILKLRGGLLLHEIINRMQQKRLHQVQLLDPRLKFFAYSAHDSTVTANLKVLGAYNDLAPPYACAVIYELHETSDDKWSVKVLYKNDTNHQNMGGPAHEFIVSGCSKSPCPMDEFIKRSQPYKVTIQQWDKQCENAATSAKSTISQLFFVIALLCCIYWP